MTHQAAITFTGVTKKYGNTTAVNNLTLTIPEGKITVFVGPSGCGKTTSLRMINRMVDHTSGQILIKGRPNTEQLAHELRRSIGYVLQQAGLMPHQTVLDNIATVPRLKGVSKAEARERAAELLTTVGLEASYGSKYPAQLSGGQAQRVGVARALASDSDILLMDEPFSAIDPVVRADLQQTLLNLQHRLGRTIVFVTHDVDEATLLGDYLAVFAPGGTIAQSGTPEEILRAPANDFVASFVGRDRGMRRLTFAGAENVTFYPLDAAAVEGWELKLEDGRPNGWVTRGRYLPGGSLFTVDSTLRDALDSVLSSPSGWGVAVDTDQRAVGLLAAENVLAATRAERTLRNNLADTAAPGGATA
ncbi:ABC transporter ATP-binding protein [Rothia nasisuis]|uniref:ABC transporter ATP-binding protein n=1 Tax=Rothia nasisuis TaxID=2109647 RepID=UPI001F2AF555|nr:ABC transporter ATP-binding protein [Rothia nasisuis]